MKTWVKISFISLIALVILAAIPVLVFVLVHKPMLIDGAGSEDTWVAFWGSFLGGIISATLTAVVSYSILYRQQDENKRALEYKIGLQNYESMKAACIELLNAIDTNIIVDATNILQSGKAEEARDIVGHEYEKIKNALNKFYIGIETFYFRDKEKDEYSNDCSRVVKLYVSFLNIIQMMMSIAANREHDDFDINLVISTLMNSGSYDTEMLSKLQHCDQRVNYKHFCQWITLSSKILLDHLDSIVGDDISRYLLLETGHFLSDKKKKVLLAYGIDKATEK